jgi:hypothetical protein
MKLKPLSYIIVKSAKNKLKLLSKKPVQLIAYLIFFGFLIFATFKSRNNGIPNNLISEDIFGCAATVLIFLLTIPDLLNSLKNGSTFFRGADINLVFTAPLRPQNILIYGFIKQIYTVLITLVFLLFQIPNLYQFSNVKPYAAILLIATMFGLMFANSINKMLLYSLVSKNEWTKRLINNVFKVLGILLVIAYFVCLYIEKSPLNAVFSLLNSKFIAYIPVYGWSKNIFMAAINGATLLTFVYAIFMVIYILLCGYLLYSLNIDYYEDVLGATELKEKTISASRNHGEKVYNNKGRFQITRKVNYKRRGNGASAIFFRHLLEYNKTGFGLINTTSVIFLVIGITVGIFKPVDDIRAILGFSVYLLMIFSFTSKWQQELGKPYIYIIPVSSFKKVVFSTVLDNVKNLIDGLILFSIIGFFFKAPLFTIILCILAFVSFGSLFIYASVLTKRVLGNTENVVFNSLIRIVLLILIILPGMGVFTYLSFTCTGTAASILPYFALIAYNLAFSSLIIVFSKGIFENIELS